MGRQRTAALYIMWAALTLLIAATQTHAQPTSIFLMQRTSGDPDFIPDSSAFKGRGLLPANDPVVADSVMVCSTGGDTIYAKDAVQSAGMLPPLTVYLTEGTTMDPPWPNAANGTILYFRIKPTGEDTWYRANVVGAAYTVGNAIAGVTMNSYTQQNVVVGGGNGASWDVKISVPNIALQFTTVPADTSGKPMRIVVTATNDNVADGTFTKQVTLSKKSGNGTLSGTLSVTASAGVATFSNVIYKASVDGEQFVLTADDAVGGTDYPSVDTSPITSNVVATKLAFQTQPAGSVSGDTLTTQPVVKAVDDSSSIDTSYTGSVTIAKSTGAGTVDGALSVNAVAGVARFHTVRYHATVDQQSFTLQASASGLTSSPSSSSVTSDVVATLLYFTTDPSATSTSGVAFSVLPVIEARDTALVKDAGFVGNVHLGVAGPGTLGPLATDTTAAFASGVASFSGKNTAYFATADSQSFHVVARATGLVPDTSGVLVSDVVATKLTFSTSPTSAPNNRAMTPQPVVKAVDAQGLVDSQFVRSVDLVRATGALDDRGTVGGVTAATPVRGTATFSGVTFAAVRDLDRFRIQATSAGSNPTVSAGLSDTVSVVVTASKIKFAVQPRYAMSGVALGTAPSVAPVVEFVDSAGVRDRDNSTTITISKYSGAGAVFGTLSGQADTSGTLKFTNVAYRATADKQAYRLLATASSFTDTSTSDTADIKASKLVFQVSPDSTTSGKAIGVQPQVWAVNDSNQVDLDYTKGVKLTVQTGAGSLSGTDSVRAVAGVATYSGVVYHATVDHERFILGARADSVTAGVSLADTADVVGIRWRFTTQPDSSISGTKLRRQPAVGYVDSAGVADGDKSGIVTLRLASGAGVLGGGLNKTASGGVATFDSVRYKALVDRETFKLRAVSYASQSDSSMSDTSSSVTSDILATKLIFTALPDSAINVRYLSRAPVVKAVDADSAVDAQFASQVTLGKMASTIGTLHGTTQKTAVAGVATFDAVYYKATIDHQTFTLKATAVGVDSVVAPLDTVEVRADRVAWVVQPAGAVSNIAFTTQPKLAAQDSSGVADRDFVDTLRVRLRTNLGTLAGTASVKADTGLAVFSGLRFKATADSQSFAVHGYAAGLDTTSRVTLMADVKATMGRVKSMPTLTYNDQQWSVPVVVWAVDADSLLDRNYGRSVALDVTPVVGGVSWLGSAPRVTAVNGVATFSAGTTNVAGDRDRYKFKAYNDSANALTTAAAAPVSDSTVVGRILPAPALIALSTTPTVQVPNQLPNLSWSNVGVAASYELDFGRTPECESILNDVAVPRQNGDVSFYQQSTRIPDGSYCWRVRTVNSDGDKSAYSSNSNFTTVPTFGEWGLIFLVASMLASGAWYLRRRAAA